MKEIEGRLRGLRAMAAQAIENRQPFVDIDDLARGVPALKKSELEQLAFIGALNSIGAANRRDALWQVARAGRPTGPLLDDVPEEHRATPLEQMTLLERVVADYQGTGVTVGAHPIAHSRAVLNKLGVTPAGNLAGLRDGSFVKVAGNVIVRQRPGTAKGVVFVSLEDETGICNLIVMPDRFEAYRAPLLTASYLLAEGTLQNTDSVIHVRVAKVEAFRQERVGTPSHDFR